LKDYWLLKINKSSAQGKKEKQKWKPDFDYLVFSSWEEEDIFFLGGKRYNTIPFSFITICYLAELESLYSTY
jgi:hypothetical protein